MRYTFTVDFEVDTEEIGESVREVDEAVIDWLVSKGFDDIYTTYKEIEEAE